jgi:hypothetical protein
LLNSGVYSRMTSDFARDFYDLIPTSLGPHLSSSRSFHAPDNVIASKLQDSSLHYGVTRPLLQHGHAPSMQSPVNSISQVASTVSDSSLLSASKKAFAARQRYVGLASARSPHASRSRFDLGLDSPGTPPLSRHLSRDHASPSIMNSSAQPIARHSSHSDGPANVRSRLVDLDSRLLQVGFSSLIVKIRSMVIINFPLSSKLISKEHSRMITQQSFRGYARSCHIVVKHFSAVRIILCARNTKHLLSGTQPAGGRR